MENKGLDRDNPERIESDYKMADNMKLDSGKYYTPSIEEFRVGFEYEYESNNPYNPNDRWTQKKFSLREAGEFDEGFMIDWYLEKDKVRVKYLDHEDIIDLGWNREMENTFTLNGFGINFPQISKGGLRVFTSDGTVFDGTIRNKSELKVLMKQLNIS